MPSRKASAPDSQTKQKANTQRKSTTAPKKKATTVSAGVKNQKEPLKSNKPKQMEMTVKPEKSMIQYEIELISLFAFTVLSAVSLHTEAIGIVGKWLKQVYLSSFGFAGFVVPYFAFLLVFFSINKRFKTLKGRLLPALILLFLSIMLFSSVSYYDVIASRLMDREISLYSSEGIAISMGEGLLGQGGGLIGNGISFFVIQSLGKFGTYLMTVVFFALSIVLGFKVSITRFVKEHSMKTARTVQPMAKKFVQHADMSLRGIDPRQNVNTRPIEAYDSDNYIEREPNQDPTSYDRWEDDLDESKTSLFDPYIDPVTGEYKDDLETVDVYTEPDREDQSDFNTTSIKIAPDLSDPFVEGTDPEITNILVNDAFEVSEDLVYPLASEMETLNLVEDDETLLIESAEDQIREVLEELKKPNDADPKPLNDLKPVNVEPDKAIMPNKAVQPKPKKPYQLPPLSLLNTPKPKVSGGRDEIYENCKILETTMKNFGVDAKVVEVTKGPTITMYEILPSPGVKVSKIVNLSDDIALALAAQQVRIIAPIPGKSAVGIEIPNKDTTMVTAREVLENDEFKKTDSKISFALGKDIAGKAVIADLGKMPHLLIAGSTGSGKSVCVNTIINSILFHASPDEVKLLMIDPKVVELSHYNGIPHLILPVVVDPKKASAALNWAVLEMTSRYKSFAEAMVKDINSYNRKAESNPELGLIKLPKIVILIDELADLMMVAPNQVEDAICRLAQMARAAGLHLIVATQRPSVDVITGLIKANIPSRIAFAVSSQIDSRTILDMPGAEKLLGKGDMLFYPLGTNKPQRVQGAFLSDAEVEGIVEFIKNQSIEVEYQEDILTEAPESDQSQEADELLQDAIELIVDTQQASISMLQRRFRVGYNRAARLVDQMEARGIVGPSMGSKPREVLMSRIQLEGLKEQNK